MTCIREEEEEERVTTKLNHQHLSYSRSDPVQTCIILLAIAKVLLIYQGGVMPLLWSVRLSVVCLSVIR